MSERIYQPTPEQRARRVASTKAWRARQVDPELIRRRAERIAEIDAAATDVILKRCTVCQVEKPATTENFYRATRGRNGLYAHCKRCDTGKAAIQRSHRPDYNRRYHLLHTYGITLEQYEAMVADQGGVCAACGEPPTDRAPLCVDHDHGCCPGSITCGKCIRGLLCRACNGTEGSIRAGRIAKVLRYMERAREQGDLSGEDSPD